MTDPFRVSSGAAQANSQSISRSMAVDDGGLGIALPQDVTELGKSSEPTPTLRDFQATLLRQTSAPGSLSAEGPSGTKLVLQVTPEVGQVQLSLNGRDLFAKKQDLGFLGQAANTIGDGARWRQPYPQDWGWPPVEPREVEHQSGRGQQSARVLDADFVREYQARPSMTVSLDAQNGAILTADIENLAAKPQCAWIVAPFAMPSGHTLDDPAAMAVFPVFGSCAGGELPEELKQLHITAGTPQARTWDYDKSDQMMFVTPGAELGEGQQKGLFTDRWSVFGRKGDSAVMFMQPKGAAGSDAFQVYAGIPNYVELEWAGALVEKDQHSQVGIKMQPVPLKELGITIHDRPLEKLGESGSGLKNELRAISLALQGRVN